MHLVIEFASPVKLHIVWRYDTLGLAGVVTVCRYKS